MDTKTRQSDTAPENPDRRKVARNTLVGGGFVGITSINNNWVKPVVGSAVLPAHAEPSILEPSIPICPGIQACEIATG